MDDVMRRRLAEFTRRGKPPRAWVQARVARTAANSLRTGKLTGNFEKSTRRRHALQRIAPGFQGPDREFPA
jgi:hypothetical protein